MRALRLLTISIAAAILIALPVATASAQYGNPSVSPSTSTRDRPPVVKGTTTTRPTTSVEGVQYHSGMSPTGADIIGLSVIGAGGVLTGTVLVLRSRRRTG